MENFKKFTTLEESESLTSDSVFISSGRIHAGRTIEERNEEINQLALTLTEQEKVMAQFEFAKMKWYKARNSEYWDQKERMKPSTGDKKIKI